MTTPLTSSPITCISSMATRQWLADVVERRASGGGQSVELESIGGVDAARRVREGEKFDLVVLAADAIAKLEAAGHVIAGSVIGLAHSPVAIAVRSGAGRPAIDSEAALRQSVLAARSLSYSTGPSGDALEKLFARWGIADDIESRIVKPPPGTPVGALLARGEVELGFQQLSELMRVEGVDVVGPMPPGCEIVTTFSGAVCSASMQPEAARALLDFIRSPAANEPKQGHGMQPA